ncbi:uncharacterized protein ABDE67_013295 [Symphorus nematophorus]
MEVDASSNITLICSSHANPPVENYTWFKIDDDDVMEVAHQPVFFSAYWATFTRDVIIISAVALLLIVTTVFAIRRLNRKREWTTKTDREEDTQNTDYINWLVCDNNRSEERNQCEEETTEVIYATIDYSKKRKSNMEQQMDSHDDEDVIYSIVCSVTGG